MEKAFVAPADAFFYGRWSWVCRQTLVLVFIIKEMFGASFEELYFDEIKQMLNLTLFLIFKGSHIKQKTFVTNFNFTIT